MQLSCKHNVTGYSIKLKKKIAYYPKVMEVLSLAGAMTDGKSNEEFLFNPVKYIGIINIVGSHLLRTLVP